MERITYRQMDKLAEGRSKVEDELICLACQGINTAEDKIYEGLENIQGRITDATIALNEGRQLNTLGIFQHEPAEVDRAIAERAVHIRSLVALVGADKVNEMLRGSRS